MEHKNIISKNIKRYIFLSILFLSIIIVVTNHVSALSSSENLVLNPSFEESNFFNVDNCSSTLKGLTGFYVKDWDKVYTGTGSGYWDDNHYADYMDDRCFAPAIYGFEKTNWQNIASDGHRLHSGWIGNGYAEYFQGSLKEPLIPGEEYEISFDIKGMYIPSYNGGTYISVGQTTNVGFDFYQDKLSYPGNYLTSIPGSANLVKMNPITLTSSYQTITKRFVATNSANYFVVGSFKGMNNVAHSYVSTDNYRIKRISFPECSDDSECDDSNAHTKDKCINPGTSDSYCNHTPIPCLNNAECGSDGFINGLFCQTEDVFQNFITYTCVNAGETNSYCTSSTAPKFKLDCGDDSCSNYGNNYCRVNDVYKSRTCHDKGCSKGGCFDNTNNEEVLVERCTGACLNGKCVNITCFNDSQCDDSNANTEDKCINPGTSDSYCSHNPINITCHKNSDCGTDGFINELFCSNNNVFQNFVTYTCVNAGSTGSYCTSSTSPKFKLDCGDDSCSNYGNNYCKGKDVYKSRTCHDKGCSNGNCFDNTNNEEVLVQTCAQACSNGKCANETQNECEEDNDAPEYVTSLHVVSKGSDFIKWQWNNPKDPDFSKNIIYINGKRVLETSDNYYNATGLSENTRYTIMINTKDECENVNKNEIISIERTREGEDNGGGNCNDYDNCDNGFSDDDYLYLNQTSELNPVIFINDKTNKTNETLSLIIVKKINEGSNWYFWLWIIFIILMILLIIILILLTAKRSVKKKGKK